MARTRNSRKKKDVRNPLLRWWTKAAAVAVGLLLIAPVADRALSRRGERSPVGTAMTAYRNAGCAVCHGDGTGEFKWRHDGAPPRNTADVSSAVAAGRPLAPGFPAAMPAYASRLSETQVRRVSSAVAMLAGLAGLPEDPELQVGREIALEMGCFRCHGPSGAGGIANPYSRSGEIPGFYGASFNEALAGDGGLESIIRSGRAAERAWWVPWKSPSVDMPAYGDRLDSVELGLLVRYLQWRSSEGLGQDE